MYDFPPMQTKYISVKLPAHFREYEDGRVNYTQEYLKERAKKLFDILYMKVPNTVFVELKKLMIESD